MQGCSLTSDFYSLYIYYDGFAKQIMISVCLLPLHFQHIWFWKSLITFPIKTNTRDGNMPPNPSPVTPVAMFAVVAASQQCRRVNAGSDSTRMVMVLQQHFVAHLQRWNHSCDCKIKTYCAARCQFAPFKLLYSQRARTRLLLCCVETDYLLVVNVLRIYMHTRNVCKCEILDSWR